MTGSHGLSSQVGPCPCTNTGVGWDVAAFSWNSRSYSALSTPKGRHDLPQSETVLKSQPQQVPQVLGPEASFATDSDPPCHPRARDPPTGPAPLSGRTWVWLGLPFSSVIQEPALFPGTKEFWPTWLQS